MVSELPGGWVETTIGEICAMGPKSAWDDDMEIGFVPMSHAPTNFRGPLNYEARRWHEVKKAYTHFENDDVIFAKVTPCFENGKAALVAGLPNGAGAGSSEFHVLRRRDAGISPSYLLAVIKSAQFLREGEENMTGAVGLRRVPRAFVENFPVRLPPEAEQKRIAQKLDALLAQVDTFKARIDAIPALLKRFRESVLTAATNGNLTEDWRTQMGSCENWTKVELADVAREFSYGSAAKSTKQGLVPVLRMGNIQNRLLDWKDLVFTSDLDEIKKYGLKDGDVLFNRTNSPELVGKTAVFKGNRDAIYAGYLIKVKCSARLLPDYLNYCLGSPLGRAYCWKVKSDGVSQSNINAKKLAAFTFDLPSVEEQTEIVRRVEQLFAYADQLEAKVAAAQKRINALTQSLLAKAFRGELVPQDPTDEPASVLLERIRTQRAAAPKPKRGRKAATS
ncbi:restriction endonuclease subunit S [Xanthomonas oryzae]|nr:restriction endonuclease subunit S [Xanthomonas oryzae]PUE97160.1 type I restriction endonuclease subunit S [Xanthomonas oryzae pv. oryzicola]